MDQISMKIRNVAHTLMYEIQHHGKSCSLTYLIVLRIVLVIMSKSIRIFLAKNNTALALVKNDGII